MNMIEKVARAIALSNRAPDSDDWPVYVNDAKAAIEAMREPTEVMVEDGQDARLDGGGYYDVWRAMIDAALRED